MVLVTFGVILGVIVVNPKDSRVSLKHRLCVQFVHLYNFILARALNSFSTFIVREYRYSFHQHIFYYLFTFER